MCVCGSGPPPVSVMSHYLSHEYVNKLDNVSTM